MYVRKEISEHTIFAFLYVFCKMYFIIIFFESIVSIIMRKSFRIMETFDKQVIEFLNIKQRKFLNPNHFYYSHHYIGSKKYIFYSKNDVYHDQYLCHYLCHIFVWKWLNL